MLANCRPHGVAKEDLCSWCVSISGTLARKPAHSWLSSGVSSRYDWKFRLLSAYQYDYPAPRTDLDLDSDLTSHCRLPQGKRTMWEHSQCSFERLQKKVAVVFFLHIGNRLLRACDMLGSMQLLGHGNYGHGMLALTLGGVAHVSVCFKYRSCCRVDQRSMQYMVQP
eukprot:1595313-Amphidinium_carterae.1